MDFPAPVATQIQPPNPQQGMQSLSGMLGIQQQRQQLQQEQMKTAQQQGIQSFFKTWDPSQHVADDGTTDLDSALQSPEFQRAGNAKPAIMQSLLDIKNKQLTNKQSLATLNSNLVNQFGQGMEALTKDPDVVADKADPVTGVNAGRAKVDQFLSNFGKLSQDTARVAGIFGPVTQHAPPGKLAAGVDAMARQGQDIAGQQAQTNPKEIAVPYGGGTKFGTVQPSTGQVSLTGPTQTNTPTPGETLPKLGTNAAGQTIAINPLNPNQAAPVGSGAAPTAPGVRPGPPPPGAPAALPGPPANPNPTTAQAAVQNTAAQGVSNRLAIARDQNNVRPQTIDALSRAKALLEAPNAPNLGSSFGMFTSLKNALSGIGIDTEGATNANELIKNLARSEATRAGASGIGHTDAGRELLEKGSPRTSIDNAAALAVINQSLATEMAGQGYVKAVGNEADPAKMVQKEQQFQNTPHLIQSYEYGLSRSPQEAERFLSRYGLKKGDLAASRAQLKALGAL